MKIIPNALVSELKTIQLCEQPGHHMTAQGLFFGPNWVDNASEENQQKLQEVLERCRLSPSGQIPSRHKLSVVLCRSNEASIGYIITITLGSAHGMPQINLNWFSESLEEATNGYNYAPSINSFFDSAMEAWSV